jgi:uncharacterized protein
MMNLELAQWEAMFYGYLTEYMKFDVAHDLEHVKRVVKNAKDICAKEQGNAHVVVPAAWLHDCVNVPKTSELRSQGSKLSADKAIEYLREVGYPAKYLCAIHHAIHAHSFSANIPTMTLEAEVVQDADRIDALGALGLSRCLMYSAKQNRPLYDSVDPFASQRELNEQSFAIDHFYTKLLKLPDSIKTRSGVALANIRCDFIKAYLAQLKDEIGTESPSGTPDNQQGN